MQFYEIQLFDEFVLRVGNLWPLSTAQSQITSVITSKVTSWERMDGFLISSSIVSGKYGLLDNGDLYIKDTTEHDGTYNFRCHVENSVTKEKRTSRNYARIIVTDPHHSQAPRITRRTNRITVWPGQRVTTALHSTRCTQCQITDGVSIMVTT
ncbi:down syndrome cell adhesion molecule-like protein Dscam2 [Caerostris extrusa]|uniref:Down syndrome cell adhesion molecule-like protein Dscam2 n=1 Tax=Caerostris extrusa TaxID=172846 RepID=A0AAV4V3Q2_CAEEX|nr:down syndrome cell adhesion molecule-like protein Dscam2 [Caerostris extrusa]